MDSTTKKSPISILGLIIWILAACFYMYEFFLRTFVGSVAHQVIPDLHLNAESFAVIGSAYYVAYGIMQIPVGVLADKFRVKFLMGTALIICSGATYLFAHSMGFNSALISRLLMGLGSSFAFICLLLIAVTWFPKRFFGFFSGASQLIGTMGPLLAGGPLIALLHTSHETWRDALVSISLGGFVLAALVFIIVREKPREDSKDLILLKPTISTKRQFNLLFKNKQAWFVALYSATSYVSIALMSAFWGTDYLQARGLSQAYAASMISLGWLGYAIACPVLGAFSDITKRRRPVMIFCGMVGLLATLAITYAPIHHMFWLYGVFFAGLGIAASGQNLGFATIAEHTASEVRATALGLNNGAIILSGAIIPPLASFFIYYSAGANAASNHLNVHDFMLGFSTMPILYVISLMLSVFFIKETFCKPQKQNIMLTPKA